MGSKIINFLRMLWGLEDDSLTDQRSKDPMSFIASLFFGVFMQDTRSCIASSSGRRLVRTTSVSLRLNAIMNKIEGHTRFLLIRVFPLPTWFPFFTRTMVQTPCSKESPQSWTGAAALAGLQLFKREQLRCCWLSRFLGGPGVSPQICYPIDSQHAFSISKKMCISTFSVYWILMWGKFTTTMITQFHFWIKRWDWVDRNPRSFFDWLHGEAKIVFHESFPKIHALSRYPCSKADYMEAKTTSLCACWPSSNGCSSGGERQTTPECEGDRF